MWIHPSTVTSSKASSQTPWTSSMYTPTTAESTKPGRLTFVARPKLLTHSLTHQPHASRLQHNTHTHTGSLLQPSLGCMQASSTLARGHCQWPRRARQPRTQPGPSATSGSGATRAASIGYSPSRPLPWRLAPSPQTFTRASSTAPPLCSRRASAARAPACAQSP